MYTAERTDLNKYILYKEGRQTVSTIQFTDKFAVWPAEGAPLTASITGSALDAYPQFSINGVSYTARRKLLTNNFLLNHYDVWLDKGGEAAIKIRLEPPKWKSRLSYQGRDYILERHGTFTFRYTLSDAAGQLIASFRETTPFLQFSVRRNFSLQTFGPIDEVLLTFAFWIGATTIYR
jgi:hypothetical protein